EKINVSKRKLFCLLLFSFITIYCCLLRLRPASAVLARALRPVLSPSPALLMGARRRGGRAAEGARLESVYAGNRIAGSNPAPSANAASGKVCGRSGLYRISARYQRLGRE